MISAFGVEHGLISKRDTDHRQVPFTTVEGTKTKVDAGIKPTLTRLKSKGVKTQYSCEGRGTKHPMPAYNSAYVLADHKSSKPVVNQVKAKTKNDSYKGHAKRAATGFKTGNKEFSVGTFRHDRKDPSYIKGREITLRRGDKKSEYSYERSVSPAFGNRTTARWPKRHTKSVNHMLDQT
jgi:hypothetical protein